MLQNEKVSNILYDEVLNKCLLLLQKLNQHEEEKISIAIEIGRNIHSLTENADFSLIRRLSRDISKRTGKLYLPSQFSEFRQLYLNFQNIERIKDKAKNVLNQLTLDFAIKLSETNKKSKKNYEESKNQYFLILQRIEKLLIKLDILIEENFPDEDKINEIIKKFNLLQDKITDIVNNLQIQRKSPQLSIFDEI
ncbi:MAG: hypothetical protein NZ826_02195 [Thermodesulfovibrio sp.]|nr:hypothetical protein [Thermodesulfovibrio sp.]